MVGNDVELWSIQNAGSKCGIAVVYELRKFVKKIMSSWTFMLFDCLEPLCVVSLKSVKTVNCSCACMLVNSSVGIYDVNQNFIETLSFVGTVHH